MTGSDGAGPNRWIPGPSRHTVAGSPNYAAPFRFQGDLGEVRVELADDRGEISLMDLLVQD